MVSPGYRSVRALLPIFAAALLCAFLRFTHAQDSIRIWNEGAAHDVKVSRYADNQDGNWLELEFPPGTGRVRMNPSEYYIFTGVALVGFRNRYRDLQVHHAVPVTEFEFKTQPGVQIISDPAPPRAHSFVDWSSLFGAETTGDLSSAIHRAAQITNLVPTAAGYEMQVLTYMKHRGLLKFNRALELVEIRLENERIPVFRPTLPLSPEDWTTSITDEIVEVGNNQKIKLWFTTLQLDNDNLKRVAKTFLNGAEITWLGAPHAEWLLDHGKLFGICARGTNAILVREAILAASLNGEFPSETNADYIEKKYFKGALIHLDKIAGERGHSDNTWLRIRSVKKEGAMFIITFSGAIRSHEVLKLEYNPSNQTAIVSGEEWALPAEVEPF